MEDGLEGGVRSETSSNHNNNDNRSLLRANWMSEPLLCTFTAPSHLCLQQVHGIANKIPIVQNSREWRG